jgi:hypothetical protein
MPHVIPTEKLDLLLARQKREKLIWIDDCHFHGCVGGGMIDSDRVSLRFERQNVSRRTSSRI